MSVLISFRLSDNEAELLNNERQDDESLSLVAARIVREKLGLSTVNTQLTEGKQTLVDLVNDVVSERLKVILQAQKESNSHLIETYLQPLTKRVETLENNQVSQPTTNRRRTKKVEENEPRKPKRGEYWYYQTPNMPGPVKVKIKSIFKDGHYGWHNEETDVVASANLTELFPIE